MPSAEHSAAGHLMLHTERAPSSELTDVIARWPRTVTKLGILFSTLVICLAVWLPKFWDRQDPATITPGRPVAVAPNRDATASRAGAQPAQPLLRQAEHELTPNVPAPSSLVFHTLLEERFTERPAQWPNDQQVTAWFAEGAYRVSARQPGQFVAIGAPLAQRVRDVVVTAGFRKVGGPPNGGYGVIVRDQGPGPRDGTNQSGQFYVLEVSDRGELGIWRRAGDSWVEIMPWTPSDAVRPGDAPNQLVARATDQYLTFLVNGIQVAREPDAVPGEGGVGIFVGGDFNEVVLDHFAVEVPS